MQLPSVNLPSAVDPVALEFDNLHIDNNASWIIAYLDIFILTAALFATLLTLEKSGDDISIAATRQTIAEQQSPFPSTSSPQAASMPYLTAEKNNAYHPPSDLPQASLSATDPWQNSTALAMQRHKFDDSISIEFKQGLAEITIGNAVLFKSSEANLLDEGAKVLGDLLTFLLDVEGKIVVQGHTDSSPIVSDVFPSNWELASARANNVIHYLVKNGLQKNRLRAVSFADTEPVAPNDNESNRQLNRRVNIVLLSPELSH